MNRYRISYIAGSLASDTGDTVEALSTKGALEAANVLVAGERELDGRGRIYFGHRMTDGGEIIGCAVAVDRLPSDFGKGAYKTAGELARKPQDRGGSTRKHRSPHPFTPAERKLATIGDRPTLIPSSGDRPNRAELASAQRELARAGLGTLNGVAVGGPTNVNPDHYAGIRTVEADSTPPLAILAARVTPASDAEIAERLAKRPRERRIGGGEAAPRYGSVTEPGQCATCYRKCGDLTPPNPCCTS